MANTIEIEIVANFKDNATNKAKALNSELDRLERRKVDVSLGTTDKATSIVDDMNNKLASIDGSQATKAIDSISAKADSFASGISEKTISVDTSAAERAIDGLESKIDGLSNSATNIWPDSIFHPYNEGISNSSADSSATEVLEEIPRMQRRASAGKYYGYDQSAIDFINEYAEGIGGLSNDSNIPDDFWTSVATQKHKEAYANGKMSALALAQFGAVNPDVLSAEDRAEYDKFMGIKPNSPVAYEMPTTSSSDRYQKYDSAAIEDFINAYAGDETDEELIDSGGLGGFWNRISPEIDKNYMVKRMARMGKMFGSTAETVKGQAFAGAGAMAGAAVAGSALMDAGNDFVSAYSSESRNDADRSMARGFTKGALTLIGGGIGSLIAPGVGTMIGAGIGGGISNLFGNELADNLSGIHKSSEELLRDRLDEYFGDVTMAAEGLNSVAKELIGSQGLEVLAKHSQAISTGFSLQSSMNDSYLGVVESGSNLDIKGNLGFHIPKTEFTSYRTQVEDYMDSIEEAMSQEMYNAFMVNDDLFGYGQWNTDALSEKYKTAFENFYKQKKELSKYLEKALKDGNFSPGERERVFGTIHGMQETASGIAPNEGEVKQGAFGWLSEMGLLSKDSYDGLQKEIWGNLGTTLQNAADTRQRAILDGATEESANAATWQTLLPEISNVSNASLNAVNNQYSDAITNARGAYWGYTQDFLSNPTELKGFMDRVGDDYSGFGREIQVEDFLGGGFVPTTLGFNKIDETDKELLKGEYQNNILPYLSTVENAAQQARALGMDTSEIDKNLLKSYEIGAMGGDDEAEQKYMAGLFAGNEELSQMVTKAMSTETGRENFSDAFKEAWDYFTDSDSSAAEAIQKQAESEQAALDAAAEKTAQAAQDGAETKAEAIEESGDAAAQAAEDSTEKIVKATEESAEKTAEAAEESKISSDVGENVLKAVNDSLSNLDDSQLQDINIGETLMNSVRDSLSADNLDFKDLGFGESLMSAISESLSPDNMDFGKVSIGQSVLNGISSSFENVDFGTLNIGSKLMETLNAGMGEGMELTPNITISSANINTDSLKTAITSAISGVSGDDSGLGIDATISGTANYELGTYPTTVPEVSGTASYEGVFPSVAPTIYGSAVYTTSFGRFARGTSDAPAGLAMVNDDGSSEPYELIEHNGVFRMYEGRNVLTMLDEHDKVYPSWQTKDILAGRSIPRYARGRNNEVISSGRDMIQGSGSAGISIGGITVSISIDGNTKGNIVDEIKSRSTEIAEIITDELERHLSASFTNASRGGE